VKICASLKSASVFLVELEQARIQLPYGPALAEDVYGAYGAWCTANRIRPLAIKDFVPELLRLDQVRRITMRVPDPEILPAPLFSKKARRLRRILLIGHRTRRTAVKDRRAILWAIRKFHWSLYLWTRQLGAADSTLIKKPTLNERKCLI
jgi:hypothetical protein